VKLAEISEFLFRDGDLPNIAELLQKQGIQSLEDLRGYSAPRLISHHSAALSRQQVIQVNRILMDHGLQQLWLMQIVES
jgi:acetyl-CoA acetyltransferase